jgi:DNA primase
LEKLLIGKGYSENELIETGIFNRSDTGELREIFYNRIVFPLKNEFGQVIAFSGRTMNPKHPAKYLNSPQTKIFNKSYELFHLDIAKPVIRKTTEVFVMEGFMDVIAAYKVGVINTVASMGTSLTEQHVTRLSRLAKKIIFAFDGDSAGINATHKALNLVGNRVPVDIVIFPKRLDPDEYLKKYDATAFVNLLQHGRISKVSFLINFIKEKYNLANETEQMNFVEEVLPLLTNVKSLVEQDFYFNQIVKLAPLVSKDILFQEVNQNNDQIQATSQPFPKQVNNQRRRLKLSQLEKAERQLLARAMSSQSVLQGLINNEKFNFKHDIYQKIYVKIIAYFLKHDIIKDTDILLSLENEARSVLYEIIELDLDDEITDNEIQDLVALIDKQALVDRVDELTQAQKTAKSNGNFEAELSLGLEIVQLQKMIKTQAKEG